MLNIWKATPKAIDFVDWLYNCAAVLRERLEWTEIQEGLTYEKDFSARGVYCDRATILRQNIKKVTMLIQEVPDHHGQKCWPWEYTQSDLML